jgi:hypothetical protein
MTITGSVDFASSASRIAGQSSAAQIAASSAAGGATLETNKEKLGHIFDRIANDSSEQVKFVSETGEETLQMSPFAAVHQFMRERCRVRVVMRRRGRSVVRC